MRTPFTLLTLMSLVLVTAVQAQPFGPRGGGGRPTPPTPEEMRDLMVIELDMDADQAAALDAIYAAHADSLAAGREAMESARDIRGQMRAARESGDEDEMDRLRSNMRAAFETGREAMTAYMDEVETILTDDQKAKLGEMMPGPGGRGRGRGPGGRGPGGFGGPGGSPIERFNTAIADIELTDEQQTQVDQLVGEMQTQFQAHREAWEELRPVFQQLREARDAGDDAQVEELRAKIREMRPERGSLRETFVAGLEDILTPEQMEQLRSNFGRGPGGQGGVAGRGRGRQAAGADLPQIMRALRSIDLSAEQRIDIRSALQATRRMASQQRESDRQKQFDDLVAAIKSVLTEEQSAQFDATLAKLTEGQGNQRRGPAATRGARGAAGQRGQRGAGRGQRGAGPGQRGDAPE